MDQQFAAGLAEPELETLVNYDLAFASGRKQLGDEVIGILQSIMGQLNLTGFELELVDSLKPSFLAYDKKSLRLRREPPFSFLNLLKDPLKIMERLYPQSSYFTLKYAFSAALLPKKIEVTYLVPLPELIETVIHENFHMFFRDLPSHALYNMSSFPEAKILEERAVEYATFRILGELGNKMENPLLKTKLQDYILAYQDSIRFEQAFHARLVDETSSLQDPEREKCRNLIAAEFYHLAQESFSGLYRNFLVQIKEDDTNSIIAYILSRAPYATDHGIIEHIEEAWASSHSLREYAEKVGKFLLLKRARQQHKPVFLMKALTAASNLIHYSQQIEP
jgi:hypothetical protein